MGPLLSLKPRAPVLRTDSELTADETYCQQLLQSWSTGRMIFVQKLPLMRYWKTRCQLGSLYRERGMQRDSTSSSGHDKQTARLGGRREEFQRRRSQSRGTTHVKQSIQNASWTGFEVSDPQTRDWSRADHSRRQGRQRERGGVGSRLRARQHASGLCCARSRSLDVVCRKLRLRWWMKSVRVELEKGAQRTKRACVRWPVALRRAGQCAVGIISPGPRLR